MSLMALMESHASPGLVRRWLQPRFDAVHVREANRDGWFEMVCWQGCVLEDQLFDLRRQHMITMKELNQCYTVRSLERSYN